MRFKGFISYSHSADGRLAPALQSALQQFAKPWYTLRALRLFRDKTTLAVTPGLWPAIETALADSEYFILLGSPEAAASPWVGREVEWWLSHRSPETILIVLTGGDLMWDDRGSAFDPAGSTALPAALRAAYGAEPLWVDLRWAHDDDHLSILNLKFRSGVLDLAATLHGRAKDELDGDDVRQYRRFRHVRNAAITVLALLLVGVGYAGWTAFGQWCLAEERNRVGRSRELAATAIAHLGSDPELALLLALEAGRIAATVQAEDALRRAMLESRVRAVRPAVPTPETEDRPESFPSPRGDRTVVLEGMESPRLVGKGLSKQGIELAGHEDPVVKVAWSPDGQRFVTIARWAQTESGGGPSAIGDRTAHVWNGELGTPEAVLRGHTREILDVAVSPDGWTAVTGGVDRTVRVWDLGSGRLLATLLGHQGTVRRVSFEPGGDRVVSTSEDGTTRVWDAGTGRQSSPQRRDVTPLALSQDGERLAVLRESVGVDVVLTRTGTSLGLLPDSQGVTAAAWVADGRRLVTGSSDRRIRLFDVDTRTVLTNFPLADAKADDEDEGRVRQIAVSSDGRVAVSSGGDVNTVSGARSARVLDLAAGREIHTLRAPDQGDGGPVYGVAISADGARVATTGEDGEAHVWDSQSGKELRALRPPRADRLLSVAWDRSRRWLVTGGRDTTAWLWDPEAGVPRAELRGHEDSVRSFAWSLDGRLLASVGDDRTVRLWSPATGQELLLLGGMDPVAVAFSRDCLTAVVVGGGGHWYRHALEACGGVPELLAAGARRVTRPLAVAERARYVPGAGGTPSTALARWLGTQCRPLR